MRIALAAANMSKPVVGMKQIAARIDRLALECRDCDVLVLPEYFAMLCLDYAHDDLKASEEVSWMANEIDTGCLLDRVEETAKRYGIAILPGTWPVETANGFVNRAHFINEDGVLAVQDKMRLTDEETDRMGWYLKPGKTLDVFEFMDAKCAMAICHDTSSSKEFEELERAGVGLVFMPSMCEFEGNDNTVDGHKWIFNHANLRSAQMDCYFACVGSVGMQMVGDRVEKNIGGAAMYRCGITMAETGPMEKGRGASAHVLKVDADV